MKKLTLILVIMAAMTASTAMAKDIRVVEISTASAVSSNNYDSNLQTILKTLSGVSKVVCDVTNLVLTVTYDADKCDVDDIVNKINKEEPRYEAKQKSEAKTKSLVKAEKKRDEAEKKVQEEQEEANRLDEQRQQQSKSNAQSQSKSGTQSQSKSSQSQPKNDDAQQGSRK